jgi:hypothetical protein
MTSRWKTCEARFHDHRTYQTRGQYLPSHWRNTDRQRRRRLDGSRHHRERRWSRSLSMASPARLGISCAQACERIRLARCEEFVAASDMLDVLSGIRNGQKADHSTSSGQACSQALLTTDDNETRHPVAG